MRLVLLLTMHIQHMLALRNINMKSFKKFLENYDVYIDMPMGFRQTEEEEIDETEDEGKEGPDIS